MQLRVARLCLDCEEVHDGQQCPVCASETFAYLSRWVPTPERRTQPRASPIAAPGTIAASAAEAVAKPYRKRTVIGWSVAGIGAVALARWWARGRERLEEAATRNAGELR
jgi:hypothetical protein